MTGRTSTPAGEAPGPAATPAAPTRAANIASYERTSGRSWDDWVTLLDDAGARGLEHPAIVALAKEALEPLGLENVWWWAQGITIGYEQHIGRRLPGQRTDGTFSANASRTVAGSVDDALAAWCAVTDGLTSLVGQVVTQAPTTSASQRWRYWRCGLADGSKVVVSVNESAPGKARVAVGHEGLATPEAVTEAKAFWKRLLSTM